MPTWCQHTFIKRTIDCVKLSVLSTFRYIGRFISPPRIRTPCLCWCLQPRRPACALRPRQPGPRGGRRIPRPSGRLGPGLWPWLRARLGAQGILPGMQRALTADGAVAPQAEFWIGAVGGSCHCRGQPRCSRQATLFSGFATGGTLLVAGVGPALRSHAERHRNLWKAEGNMTAVWSWPFGPWAKQENASKSSSWYHRTIVGDCGRNMSVKQ